jgi:hypothetical protein
MSPCARYVIHVLITPGAIFSKGRGFRFKDPRRWTSERLKTGLGESLTRGGFLPTKACGCRDKTFICDGGDTE